MPSFTFYASAEAIPHTGARPVFCDVDPETFCVTRGDGGARAHARHAGGRSPSTCSAGRRRSTSCASCSTGAASRSSRTPPRPPGRGSTGSARGSLGDAATFSFFPSKNLFCLGDGGAIATERRRGRRAARGCCASTARGTRAPSPRSGWNSRLDALQAAVLRVTLGRLDDWNDRRRALAAAYARGGARRAASTCREPRRGRGARPPPVRGPRRGSRCGVAARSPRPASPRARTTASRSTASPRWRAWAAGARSARHRAGGARRTSRCRWARRSALTPRAQVVEALRRAGR